MTKGRKRRVNRRGHRDEGGNDSIEHNDWTRCPSSLTTPLSRSCSLSLSVCLSRSVSLVSIAMLHFLSPLPPTDRCHHATLCSYPTTPSPLISHGVPDRLLISLFRASAFCAPIKFILGYVMSSFPGAACYSVCSRKMFALAF